MDFNRQPFLINPSQKQINGNGLQTPRGSLLSANSVVTKLIFSAAVYHKWGERNMKTIQNKKEGEMIVMRIEEDTIYFLCSWMKAAGFQRIEG